MALFSPARLFYSLQFIFALCAASAVIVCNKTDIFPWENHFTDMDMTTKSCGAADNATLYP